MLNLHFITIFPEICENYFNYSVIGRAKKSGEVKIHTYNPIDNVQSKERVDDKPYGGGPGMVMKADPILKSFDEAKKNKKSVKTIFLSPGGKKFNQAMAKELSMYRHLIFICGRYEGVDNRVLDATGAESVSIGDYTLTGGELPALAMADAILREVEGVLGNENSLEDKRKAGRKVYTRPVEFKYKGKNYTVPEVLRSGHHKEIDDFRTK